MELKLLKWIMNNDEKWNIICRLSDKRFNAEEAKELLEEMRKLSALEKYSDNGFNAVSMILINQYYYELFPGAKISI